MTPDEKPASKINRGDLLHLVEILVVIGGFFMSWQHFKDTGEDHGRRIVLLEENKANKDIIVQMIEQQTKNIDVLRDIVKTDHDSIVTLNARLSR